MIASPRRPARAAPSTAPAMIMVAAVAAALACGCHSQSESLNLTLRSPTDPTLLDSVDTFVFSVEDAYGKPLVLRRFDAGTASLRLDAIPWGTRLTFRVEGLFRESTVLRGRTCPLDVPQDKPLPPVSMFISRIGSFAAVAPPATTRTAPLALARSDSTVLFAGGAGGDGGALASSESFNPRTGVWASGEPALLGARRGGEAAVFGSSGDAVVVGGEDDAGQPVSRAEIYRNGEGFRALSPEQDLGRTGLRASTLPDGRVLVTGGAVGKAPASPAAMLFDGVDFQAAGAMLAPRRGHSVSALGAGTFSAAFICGGDGGDGTPVLASIELFNPHAASGGAFSAETAHLAEARADHTATVLLTGEILIIGGRGATGAPLASAEILDPVTRTVRTADRLDRARVGHTATLLADGRVLVAGGTGADGTSLRSAEIFDPAVYRFAAARPPAVERTGHVAVALCDGTVLLAGGGAGAEIYNPAQ